MSGLVCLGSLTDLCFVADVDCPLPPEPDLLQQFSSSDLEVCGPELLDRATRKITSSTIS